MILNCIDDFLEEINHFENVDKYLSNFPFTEKNISLIIIFYKDDKYTVTVDPEICCITFHEDHVHFYTNDPTNTNLYKKREKETLEEAKRIVHEEIPN